MIRFCIAIATACMAAAWATMPAAAQGNSLPQARSGAEAVSLLPADEPGLRALEHQHRRIVRTSLRQCAVGASKHKRVGATPCVISGVERGVSLSGDTALRAYNDVLPMSERYDDNRPQSIWRMVQARYASSLLGAGH